MNNNQTNIICEVNFSLNHGLLFLIKSVGNVYRALIKLNRASLFKLMYGNAKYFKWSFELSKCVCVWENI